MGGGYSPEQVGTQLKWWLLNTYTQGFNIKV